MRIMLDENFDERILKGLLRHVSGIDLVRVRDVGLAGSEDDEVLEYAARENRIVFSHDLVTMPDAAFARMSSNRPMPGLFVLSQNVFVAVAIQEILIILECSQHAEWSGRVVRLPLQSQRHDG